MNVLSLFDGMSIGYLSVKKLGFKNVKYYASEIKPHALKCAKENHKDIIHIGDVTKVGFKDGVLYTEKGEFKTGKIDLLIGGSPCQDFSILKTDGKGLEGDKSKLFYEFLRILREVKPKKFLLENVKMKKESKNELDEYLGCDGIYINSELVSFAKRPRFYWTNLKGVTIPEDRNISFQYYKGIGDLEEARVNKTPSRLKMWNDGNGRNNKRSGCANVTNSDKVYCLTRKQDRSPNSGLIEYGDFCRFLTRRELEAAQNVPLGYTDCVSYNQAQDLLGDGWTVDVICHILKNFRTDKSYSEEYTEKINNKLKYDVMKSGEIQYKMFE